MSRRLTRIDTPTDRDYLATFSSPAGKRVLFHLRRMYVNTETYVKGDTHDTAFREGKRSVVLTISRRIELAQKKPIEDPQEEEGE